MLKKVDNTFAIGDILEISAILLPKIYNGKKRPEVIAIILITKFKILVAISSLLIKTQNAPPNVIEKIIKKSSNNKIEPMLLLP